MYHLKPQPDRNQISVHQEQMTIMASNLVVKDMADRASQVAFATISNDTKQTTQNMGGANKTSAPIGAWKCSVTSRSFRKL